jgi:formylmethanofuran dehydrogenase subunit E-like metal-binding protein
MNIYDFSNYVNQDVDDTFSVEEIARWFNKAIANYNLIPPVTRYPFITMDYTATEQNEFVVGSQDPDYFANSNDEDDEEVGAFTDYPLSKNFMLAVMLPFVSSAVKGQESSVGEKQMYMQEFMMNARTYKSISNIKPGYLRDRGENLELSQYRLGENVYLTDFNQSPFAGDWKKASAYKEYVITRKKDGTIVKYVDDSLVDEDVETMEQESKY